MRATMHCGQRGNIKHNDHDADIKNAKWDKSKTNQNYIWTCVKGCDNVANAELQFYDSFFGKTLEAQNKRHMDARQTARVRTMAQWMEASQHRASEVILQIGDKDSHVDADTLWNCAVEFVNWKQERFKDNYRLLSVAEHNDESTPHIHVREVWFSHDADGLPVPGIKAGLKEANVPLPNPTEKEGRYNYRKTTVDNECRAKWQEIIQAHGISIETAPQEHREHLDTDAYRNYAKNEQARKEALKTQEQALNKKYEDMAKKLYERANQRIAEHEDALADREHKLEVKELELDEREQGIQQAISQGIEDGISKASARRATADSMASSARRGQPQQLNHGFSLD